MSTTFYNICEAKVTGLQFMLKATHAKNFLAVITSLDLDNFRLTNAGAGC